MNPHDDESRDLGFSKHFDIPNEVVDRLIRHSLAETMTLREASPTKLRGLVLAAALAAAVALVLVVPLAFWLRESGPAPGTPPISTTLPPESFSLSNRDGLLVLRSPSGQYVAVSGGAND